MSYCLKPEKISVYWSACSNFTFGLSQQWNSRSHWRRSCCSCFPTHPGYGLWGPYRGCKTSCLFLNFSYGMFRMLRVEMLQTSCKLLWLGTLMNFFGLRHLSVHVFTRFLFNDFLSLLVLMCSNFTWQRYNERSKQRLDLAILIFFQNFRRVYVGDQAMHSSKVTCLPFRKLAVYIVCEWMRKVDRGDKSM